MFFKQCFVSFTGSNAIRSFAINRSSAQFQTAVYDINTNQPNPKIQNTRDSAQLALRETRPRWPLPRPDTHTSALTAVCPGLPTRSRHLAQLDRLPPIPSLIRQPRIPGPRPRPRNRNHHPPPIPGRHLLLPDQLPTRPIVLVPVSSTTTTKHELLIPSVVVVVVAVPPPGGPRDS